MPSQESVNRLFAPAFSDLCRRSGITLAVLFGSRATQSATPDSDIDLAVVPGQDRVTGGDDLRRSATNLLKDFMCFLGTSDIDPIILNRADSLLRLQVSQTGRPLYEAAPGLLAGFCSLALRQHQDAGVFYRATDRYLERAAGRFRGHG